MIRHETAKATGLFIGSDAEFCAESFTGQYEIFLNKFPETKVLAYTEQVHGDRAIEITGDADSLFFAGEGDALFTRNRGVALLIRTADCIPILFSSKTHELIGAVHAGWRGLEKNILSKTLRAAGVQVDGCEFVVGPFIGGKSYEVGEEVADRFDDSAKVAAPRGKFFLNLRTILEAEFTALGVEKSQIAWHDTDTLTSAEWYSARRGHKQRNLAVIKARQS